MSKQKGGGWQDTYRYLPGIEHAYAVVTDDSAQTMGNAEYGAVPELACDGVLDVPICLIVDGS